MMTKNLINIIEIITKSKTQKLKLPFFKSRKANLPWNKSDASSLDIERLKNRRNNQVWMYHVFKFYNWESLVCCCCCSSSSASWRIKSEKWRAGKWWAGFTTLKTSLNECYSIYITPFDLAFGNVFQIFENKKSETQRHKFIHCFFCFSQSLFVSMKHFTFADINKNNKILI